MSQVCAQRAVCDFNNGLIVWITIVMDGTPQARSRVAIERAVAHGQASANIKDAPASGSGVTAEGAIDQVQGGAARKDSPVPYAATAANYWMRFVADQSAIADGERGAFVIDSAAAPVAKWIGGESIGDGQPRDRCD